MAVSAAFMATTKEYFSPSHFALIFSATFFGYSIVHLKPEINFNNFHVKIDGEKTLLLIALFAFIFILDYYQTPYEIIFQFLFAGILSLSYSIHLISGKRTFKGTRSVYLLKNIVLALAWALVTSPYETHMPESALLFIQRFLFLLSLSLCIDLRDLQEDHHKKIRTFALVHGQHLTKLTASILILLCFALVYLYQYNLEDNGLLAAALISYICSIISILLLKKNSNRNQYLWLIDGNLLLHGLLFFALAQH